MTSRSGRTGASACSNVPHPDLALSRRDMVKLSGMAGVAALTGNAGAAQQNTPQHRPRIACLVSYWGAPNSHADWIIDKLMDGYWWHGAHTPSRVDVVSVYIHQLDTSPLGQKVCAAKNIPIYKTVAEAVTLGGKDLAVDGVVIVAEHGNYPTNLKGQWMLPRWWIYQQVIRVFEQSNRAVPVFNDKHFSWDWDEAKWMFDKSRELGFPLTGGSSIPAYFRKPEIELTPGTPIRNSIVVGDAADEGALFHCVDVLQAFVDRRKGGETGVRSVQSIRGPESWNWVQHTAWANNLFEAVRKQFNLEPDQIQKVRNPNVTVVEYNDGTNGAVITGAGVGWTYAADIAGQPSPTLISMLGWPGPLSQYHASNAHSHWAIEMMLTKQEPFNAERLLLATGITDFAMDSCWQNGRYSAVGRRVPTPFLNMTYQSTHGPLFETAPRPPNTPYLRGFQS
ncbi:twin-arginine translocation signal domain-containing protein [Terriglobus aquaticus]|uniref:Twin-arginine translocation signal domain-containing protein n=1 Tax=Terriglobus aquaticus TaxID=940139 RepID=A0ABW9KI60_9BACT|nr:twin-arginine translocation signal domain-containing protein [Terriglobus aquaticus]